MNLDRPLPARPVRRPRVRALAALLAAGTGAALLLAPPASAVPTRQSAATGAAQGPVTSSTVNGFTVRQADGLTTITWDVVGALPMGGARPELAVDGVVVGVPTPSPDGRRLVLRTAGVVEQRGTNRGHVGPLSSSSVSRPSAVLTPDPGARGRYRTRSFTYRMPSMTISELPRRVEVRGSVVAPVGATGHRPVVLLLHGRHATCYDGDEVIIEWPCAPGFRPIPSERGYRYLQTLLASQGYFTVSIAANGVNGQDDVLADGGAGARSALVRHHLDVLAGWERGTGPRSTGGRSLRARST